ncbi:MAG: hypothetical protein ACREU7_16970 [Burkholderiales bacterium]
MRAFYAGLWLLLLCGLAAAAERGEATLNVEVPAAQWKGVRLKNLPKGTSVALQIEASGKIRVIVVDSAELRRFPRTRALFDATVETRLGFSVVIPRSGDYFVVFDNRAAAEARQVRMKVEAKAPRRKDRAPVDPPTLDKT